MNDGYETTIKGLRFKVWRGGPWFNWHWEAYRDYVQQGQKSGVGFYGENSDKIGSGYTITRWGAIRQARRAAKRNETDAERKRRTTEKHTVD